MDDVHQSDKRPSVSVDYGVISVEVTGSERDSVTACKEAAQELIEDGVENAEDIKRLDAELQKELQGGNGGTVSSSSTFN